MSLSAGIREEAWLQGFLEGYIESRLEVQISQLITNLMNTMNWSIEEAMTALKVPEEEKAIYREELEE